MKASHAHFRQCPSLAAILRGHTHKGGKMFAKILVHKFYKIEIKNIEVYGIHFCQTYGGMTAGGSTL